jgi:hypothetical protein
MNIVGGQGGRWHSGGLAYTGYAGAWALDGLFAGYLGNQVSGRSDPVPSAMLSYEHGVVIKTKPGGVGGAAEIRDGGGLRSRRSPVAVPRRAKRKAQSAKRKYALCAAA